jgi:hypothetical protein
MALESTTPHAEAIAEADNPADLGIQGDAAAEPGAKVAECDSGVVEVSNLINARLELLEGDVYVRPPLPQALVTVVGLVALDVGK